MAPLRRAAHVAEVLVLAVAQRQHRAQAPGPGGDIEHPAAGEVVARQQSTEEGWIALARPTAAEASREPDSIDKPTTPK